VIQLIQFQLEQLVVLLNRELDSNDSILNDKLNNIDIDLNDVRLKLRRLYDAVETGKLSLDDLAPRIKEHRERESDLSKARLQLEAELLVKGPAYVNAEAIKSHATDLKAILADADLTMSKMFLKTFIKRIEVNGDDVTIQYTLPMPPQGKMVDRVSVLPIETLSREYALFVTKV
jgi:predicted nuclease with TOPRIM domain